MESILDAIFAIDIVLTFFVAYFDSESYLLVFDHTRIVRRLGALIALIMVSDGIWYLEVFLFI